MGGRLGNMMFGIAAIIGTAKKNNATPMFPAWKYGEYFKNYLYSGEHGITGTYQEPKFTFTEILFNEEQYGYNLSGYFQSEKYFDECSKEVKEMFTPKNEYQINNDCSIHVRRGDYVGSASYVQYYDMDYYSRAVDYIHKTTGTNTFRVFSDEIDWCKNNFKNKGDIEFIFSENKPDIVDLFLISSCKNHIITNSTFSWWGSYLGWYNEKIIVAPPKWFTDSCEYNGKDIYCKNWTILDK